MDKVRLIETFEDTPAISLIEDSNQANKKSNRVDGKYIIGMIEGQFFKPDGMSRNGRWYPRSLWTKSLAKADIKNRLQSSTMFGEIGHSDGPVEDMTLRQGCASHFIDDLWIDEAGRGMGRAYILNTPTGQLLKIYLGAGCKLKVSTRGEGSYKEGETHDGCPVVDDETYDFQTVDFVLNPGFLETSAVLKESYNKLNNIEINRKQIEETIAHVKKEGEKRMELNIDAYVADLKEELKALKAENKSLNEQLQAKNNELLQSKLNGNVEVKKLTEELKPFKALKVSAKSITENFKKLQSELKKTQGANVDLDKKLKAYESYCGSVDELKEGIKLSAKSLKMIEEYRKIGTPEQFKEAMTRMNEKADEAVLEKSISYIKSLKEKLSKANTSKRQLIEANKNLARSARVIKDLTKMAEGTEKLIAMYKGLRRSKVNESVEYKKLALNASKLMKQYEALRRENAGQRTKLDEAYVTLNRATKAIKQLKGIRTINESVTSDIKKDALQMSEKYGCTVETAAKLIKKNGVEKANKMVENAVSSAKASNKGLIDSQKLVEEVAQLDKVTTVPAEKTAKDFLKDGMIKNYFNHDALGKEVVYKDFSQLDGTKVAGENKAVELLKKYNGNFEVEKAPKGLDKELTPAQAEAEAKKLLK